MRKLHLIFFFFALIGFGLTAQNDDLIDFTDTTVSSDYYGKEEGDDFQDSIFNDLPFYEFHFQLVHLTRNKFNLEYRKNVSDILGDPKKETFWPFGFSNILVILIGLTIASLFILTEVILIKNQKYWLDPFVKRILLIDDILDNI